MTRALKPGLAIAGTAIGLVGLGALVFARLFEWAAEQHRPAARN